MSWSTSVNLNDSRNEAQSFWTKSQSNIFQIYLKITRANLRNGD